MREQWALLPGYLSAHLQLSLTALLIGAALAVPLGVAIHRRPRWEPLVLGVASVIQTVPSLALLAVMVPLFAALGLALAGSGVEIRAIGALPALVALTLYSLLPMLRNTVIGLAELDPAVLEAARGVGMNQRQQLWRVELPLALPVIVAGVRTAAVWVVGTATLSTPIGATSLGNFIFSGLATRNDAAILMGCLAAAGLALGLDQLIRLLEAGLRQRRPLWWGSAAAALAALVLYVGVAFALGRPADGAVPVRIGSKAFTEQYVLAELLAQRIETDTRHPTVSVPSLGSTVAFDALAAGDLDLYVDYSGTIWATIMQREGPRPGREALTAEVGRYLADVHGIALVAALGFENSYALALRRVRAEALGVARISQLGRHASGLAMGGDYEFFARAEWRDLVARYGLAFREQRSMDAALLYAAVAADEVDVISAYTTDGRIAAFDLLVLEDDLGVIPPYDALVLASPRLARERPEVLAALRPLAGAIDAATMRRMNHAVDSEGQTPAAAAAHFLETLPPSRRPDRNHPIRAGHEGSRRDPK